jgi:hypothetical protein
MSKQLFTCPEVIDFHKGDRQMSADRFGGWKSVVHESLDGPAEAVRSSHSVYVAFHVMSPTSLPKTSLSMLVYFPPLQREAYCSGMDRYIRFPQNTKEDWQKFFWYLQQISETFTTKNRICSIEAKFHIRKNWKMIHTKSVDIYNKSSRFLQQN